MRFENLISQLMLWGKVVKAFEIPYFRGYIDQMLKRNRVIFIEENGQILALICFFLVDETASYSNRPFWSCPEDNENGHIFFVDKMIARKWTPSMRRFFERQIVDRFPQVDTAFWLREPNNRNVIIRRREYELHSQMA